MRTKHFIAAALVWLASSGVALADPAFAAFGSNAASGYLLSYTHTSAAPQGVIVVVSTDGANVSTGVTANGQALALACAATGALSEFSNGRVELWFLGSGLTGTNQTITVSNPAGDGALTINSFTVTAAANTEFVDSDCSISSSSQANPSVTLSLGGRSAFAMISGVSGQDAVSGITPLTSWTSRQEEDYGTVVQFSYSYNTIGTADITAGWTQAADDALAVTGAVAEVVAAGLVANPLSGRGADAASPLIQ